MATVLSTKYKGVCGLYKISIADKFYYGSSANLYNRAYQHSPELRHNRHKNKFMQRAYNKYREFKFEVIAICEPEQRRELEQKLLQKCLESTNCMNLTFRTEGPSGLVWTKEARQNMSEKMKGNTNGRFGKGISRNMSAEHRVNQIASVKASLNQPVIAVNKDTGEKMQFISRLEASSFFGIPHRTFCDWVSRPNRARRKYNNLIFKGVI